MALLKIVMSYWVFIIVLGENEAYISYFTDHLHTGDTDDVRCSRRHQSLWKQNRSIQTSTILLGKHAYFGLAFCINVVLTTL